MTITLKMKNFIIDPIMILKENQRQEDMHEEYHYSNGRDNPIIIFEISLCCEDIESEYYLMTQYC